MQKTGGAKSIASQLSAAHAEEVKRNRKYIMKITDILRLIATQSIALRGHDESALMIIEAILLKFFIILLKMTLHLKGELKRVLKMQNIFTTLRTVYYIFLHT